jgi:hypothetical protein
MNRRRQRQQRAWATLATVAVCAHAASALVPWCYNSAIQGATDPQVHSLFAVCHLSSPSNGLRWWLMWPSLAPRAGDAAPELGPVDHLPAPVPPTAYQMWGPAPGQSLPPQSVPLHGRLRSRAPAVAQPQPHRAGRARPAYGWHAGVVVRCMHAGPPHRLLCWLGGALAARAGLGGWMGAGSSCRSGWLAHRLRMP